MTKHSIKRQIIVYLAGLSVILAFAFVTLLSSSFVEGLKLHISSFMDQQALRISANPQQQTPHQLTEVPMILFSDIKQIPPEVLVYFEEPLNVHQQTLLVDEDEEDGESEFPGYLTASTPYTPCTDELCEALVIYSYQKPDGDWFYLLYWVTKESFGSYLRKQFIEKRRIIYGSALLLAAFIIAIGLFLVRKIAKPIEQLSQWSEQLTIENFHQPTPDFRYHELNQISDKLHGSLQSIVSSLDNERRFLRNASHELRTPIAIMRGNLEILEKIHSQTAKEISDIEWKTFLRLQRSVQSMQQLTTTLLWLSRPDQPLPECDEQPLNQLLDKALDDCRYMLGEQGKISIKVEQLQAQSIEVVSTPCYIILSNLIRNAIQHTEAGEIEITLDDQHLLISNPLPVSKSQKGEVDYGFGLGIKLVEQIAERFRWQFTREIRQDMNICTVYFSSQSMRQSCK